ncbi:MAG: DUF3404 domain-containing protein [Deltaproteobacteria bacterium]|nr:MAG: DUF3404 domain-containing protein [Deltaproteobacteria bacterium]
MWLLRATWLWLVVLLLVGSWLGWYAYTQLSVPSEEALRLQVFAVPSLFRATAPARDFLHVEKVLESRPASLFKYESLLPSLHQASFADSSAFASFQQACTKPSPPNLRGAFWNKAIQWELFRCGRLQRLESSFFQKPPFVHPLGHSYVYRAWKTNRPRFRKTDWLEKHWQRLHVLELSKIPVGYLPLDKMWLYLHKLGWQPWKGLLQGQTLVVGTHWVFVREVAIPPTTSRTYRVFRYNEFSRFLKERHLRLSIGSTSSTGPCLVRQGALCWSATRETSSLWGIVLGGVLFSLSLGLLVHLVFVQVRRYWERQQLQKKHSFLIQTLTHELRTPATALQLVVDSFRRDYDDLPDSSQVAFLRMSQELQKLKRVIHASQQYLQSNLNDGTVSLQKQCIPSVHRFVADIVSDWAEEHDVSVEVVADGSDGNIQLDRYWFKLCLNNLLSNALFHGKPPVKVFLQWDDSWVKVAVQDQGAASLNLGDLLQPFYKGEESHGLGLGLGIVEHLVREMGGSLSLTTQPTTFTIQLERKG